MPPLVAVPRHASLAVGLLLADCLYVPWLSLPCMHQLCSQDYGYWYNQGLLYPDLLSAMVALEPASQENGCLQLLRGTQSMGRIDHSLVGQQQGADFERVSSAMERHDLVYATMEAARTKPAIRFCMFSKKKERRKTKTLR